MGQREGERGERYGEGGGQVGPLRPPPGRQVRLPHDQRAGVRRAVPGAGRAAGAGEIRTNH